MMESERDRLCRLKERKRERDRVKESAVVEAKSLLTPEVRGSNPVNC